MVDAFDKVAVEDKLEIVLADGRLCPAEHVLPAGPEPLLEFVLADRESFVGDESLGPKADGAADVEVGKEQDDF
jgi:hypothetical protein